MSKTLRRTNRKPPLHVTHGWDWPFHRRTKREGKDLAKSLAIWFSDSNYKTGWYNQGTDVMHRMEAKRQLSLWFKNPDYEVQIRRKHYRDWE